eukprot:1158200-Pelagomonas_calceolata.AAC.2
MPPAPLAHAPPLMAAQIGAAPAAAIWWGRWALGHTPPLGWTEGPLDYGPGPPAASCRCVVASILMCVLISSSLWCQTFGSMAV